MASFMKRYKILVKFPSRERPKKFKEIIERYNALATDKTNIQYLVSLDRDDPTLQLYLSELDNMEAKVTMIVDDSTGKIHACNRDMDKARPTWDILILASDDMVCQEQGWDNKIREDMREHFPQTDGALYYHDGDPATAKHNDGKGLCTMCIMGRQWYNKFKYIYHPDYISLFCDNEYTEVAQKANKMFKSDAVLFKHVHFSNSKTAPDRLMKHTQSFYEQDRLTYERRKKEGFPI